MHYSVLKERICHNPLLRSFKHDQNQVFILQFQEIKDLLRSIRKNKKDKLAVTSKNKLTISE